MIDRAALRVDRAHPGSVLLVGELSRQAGGDLPGHSSHESGRDADIAFYYRDERGRPVRTARLAKVDADGRVAGSPDVLFDERRTWKLIEAFLTDPDVIVQRIFIADTLRKRLLQEALASGASRQVIQRAEFALKQPSSGPPHDDHLHLRVACPREQTSLCVAEPGPGGRPLREARMSARQP